MKRISFWAKCHPTSSRIFIVIIKMILIALAVYAGMGLAGLNIHVSENLLYGSILGSILTAFIYTGLDYKGYTFRKTCDTLMIALTFTAILAISNKSSIPGGYQVMASITRVHHTAEQILESLKYRDKSTLTRQEKRILKKEFFRQVKNYSAGKIMNDEEKSSQAILIILTIIAAVGLTYLLGALVCSISCNGSEALAIIVGVIGLAGLIWATITVINAIKKKHQKKVTPNTSSQG